MGLSRKERDDRVQRVFKQESAMSRGQRQKDMQDEEVDDLMKTFDLLEPILDRLKRKHKGKPYDETVDCPKCKCQACLRLAWSGPRAAIFSCSTPNCIRMVS